jgi:nucleolar protein 4
MGNLPFDVEKEDIEEIFSVFGAIRYVRLVYDREKDRPKGIAFLQFNEKSDADSCLKKAETQSICIGGRTIAIKKAVDSKQLSSSSSKPDGKDGKDNRNLHLAMEGYIKEGTNAAAGISKADMMKRKLALEAKKKKLKNINFFVSTERLCIRNMSTSFSETDLKQLMSKYGHVVQVKIMRDIKQANSAGIGKSRGYGFVQFSKHEAALAALRATNNNPNIFTSQKRPIVDFSIENSAILNARAKKGSAKDIKVKFPKTKKSFNTRWKEKREKRKESGASKKRKDNPETTTQSTLNDQPQDESAVNKKRKKKKRQKQNSNVVGQNKGPDPKSDSQTSDKPSIVSDSISKSRKSAKRQLKGKSERPNKKQKRDKEQGQEAAFQKLVLNYKGKLQSDDSTRTFKKWYDD